MTFFGLFYYTGFMRRILALLLAIVILVLILEGIFYLYLVRSRKNLSSALPEEPPKPIISLTINNLHPNLKLELARGLDKKEAENLIASYNKNQVEVRVVANEEDLPPRPQGGGRGAGTYSQKNGRLVLQYRVWGPYPKSCTSWTCVLCETLTWPEPLPPGGDTNQK